MAHTYVSATYQGGIRYIRPLQRQWQRIAGCAIP